MSVCRNCKGEHPPTMRCEVAARLATGNVVTSVEVGENVTTDVTTPKISAGRSESERVVAWKRGNRERYNAYMRELRARKRAGFSGGT